MRLFFSFNLFIFSICVVQAQIEISEREMKINNFPCSKCHSDNTNTNVTFPLSKPHDKIQFNHMKEVKNCSSCHHKKNRNELVLITGQSLSFNLSYLQCAQCHGEKFRDWELGIHGKQIGSWDKEKYRFNCTDCHNPHSPQFPKYVADPAPKHPSLKRKGYPLHE